MTQIIDTPSGISVFVAISMKAALKLWDQHRMKANRAYTPKAMMQTAERITNKKFKPRDYKAAIDALDTWIKEQK